MSARSKPFTGSLGLNPVTRAVKAKVFTVPGRSGSEAAVTVNVDAVRAGMRAVVNEPGGTAYGTFHGSDPLSVEVCGKTGTAQTSPQEDEGETIRTGDMTWFAGFAPYRNPQIAFAVVVENAGFGASSAAPVAKKLVQYWFLDRLVNPLPPPRGKLVDPFAPQQPEAPE